MKVTSGKVIGQTELAHASNIEELKKYLIGYHSAEIGLDVPKVVTWTAVGKDMKLEITTYALKESL